MRTPKRFYVYVMTNGPRAAILYIGITGDLTRRVWQHKNRMTPGFTQRYNLTRLVHYECFIDRGAAIGGEKETRGWRRGKKIALVESTTPGGEDLAGDWQNIYKPQAAVDGEIPRPAGENAGTSG